LFGYYKIDSNTGDAVRVDRGCKLIEGAEYDVQILSKRYEHPSVNGRFVRKIYTGRSPSNSRIYENCMMLAVRIPEGAERQRLINQMYAGDTAPPLLSESAPSAKRFRGDAAEAGSSTESAQALLYRTECELQTRQASILDRFEAFMDRLERISMCLPQLQEPVQQVWLDESAHDDEVAHEEEIILDGTYNEDFVSHLP
ncbi:unnamed protein product, partial [Strongylus vulgaris]